MADENIHAHPQSRDSDNSQRAGERSLQARTGDISLTDRAPLTLAIIALCLAIVAVTVVLVDRGNAAEIAQLERSHVDALFAQSDAYRRDALAEIKRKYDLIDNDWVQMNSYLAANGVMKDDNGFYVKDGKRLSPQKGK